MTKTKKNILIGGLDWGLGHASRMIPIINYLISEGHNVIIAGNGSSLKLLQENFSFIKFIEFSGPKITYASNKNQVIYLMFQAPRAMFKFWMQKNRLRKIVKQLGIDLIISDNRPYFRNKKCKNIYITHQIFPLAGSSKKILSKIATKLHLRVMRKYQYCLIPDAENENNLSGLLSHGKLPKNTKYIGWLSRFDKLESLDIQENTVLIVLSGPEPQRSILENILHEKYRNSSKKVFLVRGTHSKQKNTFPENFKVYDIIENQLLIDLFSQAETIICRSGYSSLMDLASLGRKAVLIPTIGQVEQEYLAEYFNLKFNFKTFTQEKLININVDELICKDCWSICSCIDFTRVLDEII
ncbi:MAG: UDP-N-acetylglucosamine--N-acetylmuramyl-(pentapeptide) pyrophosphoryl-undecaprenol N-acetylglucosamine transferase [Bacteroidales bacterium]|nr:UDP-N-acetylglucosamine--N-acetylmuramyl-(pentapeptide) pyrophosphoryl-undecaprenol N-acetylglucosamine transferase [Bacteroidales bacterium]